MTWACLKFEKSGWVPPNRTEMAERWHRNTRAAILPRRLRMRGGLSAGFGAGMILNPAVVKARRQRVFIISPPDSWIDGGAGFSAPGRHHGNPFTHSRAGYSNCPSRFMPSTRESCR